MVIVGLTGLFWVGLGIWLIYFSGVIAETAVGKIVLSFTLLPLFLVAAAFMAVICGVVLSLPILLFNSEQIVSEPTPIYSVVDNQGENGRFALGCGSLDSEITYYFVINTESGKKVQSSKQERTYINESEDAPYMTTTHTQTASRFAGVVFIDLRKLVS